MMCYLQGDECRVRVRWILEGCQLMAVNVVCIINMNKMELNQSPAKSTVGKAQD